MTVTLVRKFSAVKGQREFSAVVRYGAGGGRYELLWSAFKCADHPEESCFPFETLRIVSAGLIPALVGRFGSGFSSVRMFPQDS